MPNLTALANQAIVFDHAYAAYPESIKGLFSILCSAYPALDKSAESYADAPCASIADVLGRRGYRTALFHSGRFGYLGMESIIRRRGYDVLEDAGDIGGHHESSFGVDEPSTVARILNWIDTLSPSDRFFITYLPIAGHHPYETPGPGPFPERSDVDRYGNALYDGDAALGALIHGLRARGLEEHTLWVIFGDHGEAFGQHDGNYGHTFQIFDENVHVPFIVAAPGLITRQIRSVQVVSLIDTSPTLLDAIGEPAPDVYQGRSMLDGSPRMAFFFADYSLGLLGLRDGRFKMIYELGSGRARLYDVERDPREMTDLSRQHVERTAWYARDLTRWSAAQEHRLAAAR
jgi:arylsulfatase A-like enzyme